MKIIGIDPDTKKHGVATYEDNKLVKLESLQLQDIVEKYMRNNAEIIFSVEHVSGNKFLYGRNNHKSKTAQTSIGMRVGQCMQSEVELVRALDYYGCTYVSHKPQRGNWAKNKKQFELVTGWEGRSNEDTRSAAFFGYLALNCSGLKRSA